MKTKLKIELFVCDIIGNHLFCACICECEHDEISMVRRIYDLLKTGSLFLFSYLLFVFFRGLRSSLLSLTARINPDGAVKEFSQN